MKISIFQAILLGFFVVAGLIGLFVFSTYQGSSGGSEDIGAVVIWGTLPSEEINQALTKSSQTNQALKSVTYVEKNPFNFESEIVSAIASGNAPDLVLISQESLMPLVSVLQVTPASKMSVRDYRSAFVEGGELFLLPNGAGAYGIPLLVDPIILYQNRTILSSSGIAQPPTTWEALTGLASRIVVKSETSNVSRGLIALGTYANIKNAQAILATLFLQAGVKLSTVSTNGLREVDLGGRASGGTPPGEAVLRFYTQFADSSKVFYTWNASLPEAQIAFTGGDLGLYLGFASEAKFFRAANPNLNFDVAPVPQLATSVAKTTYGKIYALAIPRGAKNPDGAYLASVALTGLVENQNLAVATALAPADRALLVTTPPDPTAAVAYSSALYAKGWLSPARVDVDRIFSAMINNVISGRQTIDTALNSAETSLEVLLRQ